MPKDTKTTMVLLLPTLPALYQMCAKFCTIKGETLDYRYFWGHANIQQFPCIHSPTEVKIIPVHFVSSTQPLIFQLPGSKIQLCILTSSELTAPTKFSVLRVNTTDSNNCGTSDLHSLNSNLQPNSCSVQTQKCEMVPCPRIMSFTGLARSNEH